MSKTFHSRFNIKFPIEEAQGNFINRVANALQYLMKDVEFSGDFRASPKRIDDVLKVFMQLLGKRFVPSGHNSYYSADSFVRIWEKDLVKGDFWKCLEALEKLGIALQKTYSSFTKRLDEIITSTLALSEVELEVAWQNGVFVKKGAALLDADLVNESLRWLSDPKYKDILVPFEKGLKHFVEADRSPERRGDVITDMYEAMEALAKIVTSQPSKELSALREAFISVLQLPDVYRRMLKEYIDYGCSFRHAGRAGQTRTWPSDGEAEAFVYLTGLFIRLAIQSTKK